MKIVLKINGKLEVFRFVNKVTNSRSGVKYYVSTKMPEKGIYVKKQKLLFSYEKRMCRLVSKENIPTAEIYNSGMYLNYFITRKVKGNTLYSMKELDFGKRLEYQKQMGKCLALIHSINTERVRKSVCIWDCRDKIRDENIDKIESWLRDNSVDNKKIVFVHGDYQLGNILLSDNGVEAVLDWEFAGMGWRESDIAWAITIRQGCPIYLDEQEVESFIGGYLTIGKLDSSALLWCRVGCLLFFYRKALEECDDNYSRLLLERMDMLIKKT